MICLPLLQSRLCAFIVEVERLSFCRWKAYDSCYALRSRCLRCPLTRR
jgi:hypothetical protein